MSLCIARRHRGENNAIVTDELFRSSDFGCIDRHWGCRLEVGKMGVSVSTGKEDRCAIERPVKLVQPAEPRYGRAHKFLCKKSFDSHFWTA